MKVRWALISRYKPAVVVMADGTVSGDPAKSEEQESGGVPDVDAEGGLTGAQRELLERCLRALQQAENDSHTLAALLLVRTGLQRGKGCGEEQFLRKTVNYYCESASAASSFDSTTDALFVPP